MSGSNRGKQRGFTRRTFLKAIGAAGAVAGCSPKPGPQLVVPYLNPPEHIVPGTPLFYRTVCRECAAGCGVTARTREGRVVKLEGNPDDPIGRGALCARGQAALQVLYAPDRPRGPMRRSSDGTFAPASWDDALGDVAQALDTAMAKPGAPGVRLLTRSEPGSAGVVQRAFLASLGAQPAQRIVFEPFEPGALHAAGDALFGRPEIPIFDLGKARSVISFGADFVDTWVSPMELSRGFASGRGRIGPERTRLTWVGPRLSVTGASADVWIPVKAGTEHVLALALLRWICDPANSVPALAPEADALFSTLPSLSPEDAERRTGIAQGTVARLGRELAARRPSAVLGPGIASTGLDATSLASALLLVNFVLGNMGRTVLYGLDPLADPPAPFDAVRALIAEMSAGAVDVLIVHHADPLGTLPSGLGFSEALDRVPLIVSLSDRMDATTRRAHVLLPDHHALESFGDVSPRKGIVALSQPVMTPLWETRSAGQTLLDVAGKLAHAAAPAPAGDFESTVRDQVTRLLPGASGDATGAAQFAAFRKGGVYADVQPQPVQLRMPPALPKPEEVPEGGGEYGLVCYLTVSSGYREAAHSWLGELPDPMTTVSWSDWAEISPATAERLGVGSGDVLALTAGSRMAELPAYVTPAIRDDAVAIPLGGSAPLVLLGSEAAPGTTGAAGTTGVAWLTRVQLARTGRKVLLPRLEGTSDQGEREIVRTVSRAAPALPVPRPKQMYARPAHPEHRWAMAIDLDRCTGCQACIVACYAENNIPVNGPVLDARGRNMEWLRLERYYERRPEGSGGPRVDLLLMLCQHCTAAPCEPVCPVYATYHTSEGLNAQVYNRCVGTRYCSNNCPYKVRTFNWRDAAFEPPLDFQLNPDVSVRSKGVMEKCTFCVQRIRAAEITAESEKRPIRDGEVMTACEQACATAAIVFGDLHDPAARVTALFRDPRAYAMLDELNTEPGIRYLAKVRDA